MRKFAAAVIGLMVFSLSHAAQADCAPENAKRCSPDDGAVQICTSVAGSLYWTTQEYKCTENGEIPNAPVEACEPDHRRCGDDGFEQICLEDGDTFSWFRMKPHVSCR